MAAPDDERDAKLREWRGRCKPDEYLASGDDRYVNFNDATLRGADNAVEGLLDLIELSRGQPSCQLFSGFSGTGKTTELHYLRKKLLSRKFVVLYSDAADYHDLKHEIDIESLLIIIAAAFGDAASQLHGGSSASEGYFKRFVEFLDTDLNISEATGKHGGVGLKVELQHQRPLWLQVRDQLKQSLAHLKAHSHKFIAEHSDKLNKKFPGYEIVFILDSFEKLQASEDEFQGVLDSVRHVFGSYSDMLKLPGCHTVYTVPLYLQYIDSSIAETYDNRLFVLPSIKVIERNGDPYKPGIAKIDEMLRQRVDLDELFGKIREDAVSQMALASAGHVRTLMRMMSDLLRRARRHGLPVSSELLESVIAQTKQDYYNAVRAEYLPILKNIYVSKSPRSLETKQLSLFARLLNNQLILCYHNGSSWLDVHPLIKELLDNNQDVTSHE